MILDKLLNILAQMPVKSQKAVLAKVDFSERTPAEVYKEIVATMQSVARSAAQKSMLELYADMPISDADILAAFGDRQSKHEPLTFDDEQIEYIRTSVYRNRNGEFRLIPKTTNCSAESIPLDGLEADRKIIGARLARSSLNDIGAVEKFDGLGKLEEQPYDGPYDGIMRQLAPNLQRINIISSFKPTDTYGFFVKDNQMYRNVCAKLPTVDPSLVSDVSLRRAMLLLYLVAGGKQAEWEQLYRIIHFMVCFPDSSNGIILYLNDFDAGGNGKSKLVSVLQTMFGDTFTAFAPQQLRFTMSLMGKRLVSISEFEDNNMNQQLQGIMKSMTGRDRFQYEGKGQDPVTADTYQNFVISSNRYIYFEDSGIKRRLQNFHCSNLLHSMLTKYCKNQTYLDKFFGNVFDGSAQRIKLEMAHSLLNYIQNDTEIKPIDIKAQQIILGSLKNPVLRALFSTKMSPDNFIAPSGDGSRIDLYRLSSDAKPEQLNYAASTLQAWFPDIAFTVSRDCATLTSDVPEPAMIEKMSERLKELDNTSKTLKAKSNIKLEFAEFRQWKSRELVAEFLGEAITQYRVPFTNHESFMEIC